MALYASDGEELIFAVDASPRLSYRCLECHRPVKIRRGINRVPHFYHLQSSSSCHLYSKSEDHLLLQLQLKKSFPQNSLQIERFFEPICRIADLCWEKEKIVFEIQCSPLELSEANQRTIDYRKAGYEIVWLLDDRLFNKWRIRSAEEWLRTTACYFFSFNRFGPSQVYDQFEIAFSKKRFRKGRPLSVNLSAPRRKPSLQWPDRLPEQVKKRIETSTRFFPGDIIHKTLLSSTYPSIANTLENWCAIEHTLKKANRPPTLFENALKNCITYPYLDMLEWLLKKVES